VETCPFGEVPSIEMSFHSKRSDGSLFVLGVLLAMLPFGLCMMIGESMAAFVSVVMIMVRECVHACAS